jgi:hypothetical protein
MKLERLQILHVLFALALMQIFSSCSTQERTGKQLITKRLYQKGYHLQVAKSTIKKNPKTIPIDGLITAELPISPAQATSVSQELANNDLETAGSPEVQSLPVVEYIPLSEIVKSIARKDLKKAYSQIIAEEDPPDEELPVMKLAVLGLILTLLVMPVGVVVCFVALSRFKKYPGKWSGRGFAVGGLIIALVCLILAIAFMFLFIASY